MNLIDFVKKFGRAIPVVGQIITYMDMADEGLKQIWKWKEELEKRGILSTEKGKTARAFLESMELLAKALEQDPLSAIKEDDANAASVLSLIQQGPTALVDEMYKNMGAAGTWRSLTKPDPTTLDVLDVNTYTAYAKEFDKLKGALEKRDAELKKMLAQPHFAAAYIAAPRAFAAITEKMPVKTFAAESPLGERVSHAVARNGNDAMIDIVIKKLRKTANDHRNALGRKPTDEARLAGNWAFLKKFYAAGGPADPLERDPQGNLWIHHILKDDVKNIDTVLLDIMSSIDVALWDDLVNAPDASGKLPVQMAIASNNVKLVRVLKKLDEKMDEKAKPQLSKTDVFFMDMALKTDGDGGIAGHAPEIASQAVRIGKVLLDSALQAAKDKDLDKKVVGAALDIFGKVARTISKAAEKKDGTGTPTPTQPQSPTISTNSPTGEPSGEPLDPHPPAGPAPSSGQKPGDDGPKPA